jgi:hypothetical protein
MGLLQRPKKITIEGAKKAIQKIKRRKGINKEKAPSRSIVAKELGCSRQYLYREEFDVLFEKKDDSIKAKRGTIAYYKEVSDNKTDIILRLEKRLDKALANIVDRKVLQNTIDEQEKELADIRRSHEEEKSRLREDNRLLREKIMRDGLRK